MSSVKSVCIKGASNVYVRCMTNAWANTHGAKCVKHTTNDQNMLSMHKHGNPQKFVLNEFQNNEKNTI